MTGIFTRKAARASHTAAIVTPASIKLPASAFSPDANLTGAANNFEALERLRKVAFAETVPAPKTSERIALELTEETNDEEEEA